MELRKIFQNKSIKAPAFIGLLMVAPTTIFLISVLLKYGFGIGSLFDPMDSFYSNRIVGMLIFFCPFAALILNLIYIIGIKAEAGEGTVRFNFEIKLRALNIAVSLIGLLYSAVLFSYLVTENLGHYYRGQM